MKKLTKYLSLILAVILSLTSLSGAVAEEIGDQITFAYYVNDGLLCQLGVEGESTRPATKIVAQLDQATVYYWAAPAEGETAGRLYVDSFLSSNSEPTLISDQVYGEPVYVQKDSKIYFLDASDSRLLKAVQVAPYQFNIAAGDVATLPFADTTLSDSPRACTSTASSTRRPARWFPARSIPRPSITCSARSRPSRRTAAACSCVPRPARPGAC